MSSIIGVSTHRINDQKFYLAVSLSNGLHFVHRKCYPTLQSALDAGQRFIDTVEVPSQMTESSWAVVEDYGRFVDSMVRRLYEFNFNGE